MAYGYSAFHLDGLHKRHSDAEASSVPPMQPLWCVSASLDPRSSSGQTSTRNARRGAGRLDWGPPRFLSPACPEFNIQEQANLKVTA